MRFMITSIADSRAGPSVLSCAPRAVGPFALILGLFAAPGLLVSVGVSVSELRARIKGAGGAFDGWVEMFAHGVPDQ